MDNQPWIETLDEDTKQTYYYNPVTGETSWERKESMNNFTPPPPPPKKEIHHLIDFAKTCGWNGLTIKDDYEIKKWWDGKPGLHWNNGNPPNLESKWLDDVRIKHYCDKENVELLDCKSVYYLHTIQQLDSDYPMFCFKGKNKLSTDEYEPYFPRNFYPSPQSYIEYWRIAKTCFEIDDVSYIDTCNSLGLQLLKPKISSPTFPSPKSITNKYESTTIAFTIMHKIIKNQNEKIKKLETLIDNLDRKFDLIIK